jgi:hypothetical protein
MNDASSLTTPLFSHIRFGVFCSIVIPAAEDLLPPCLWSVMRQEAFQPYMIRLPSAWLDADYPGYWC